MYSTGLPLGQSHTRTTVYGPFSVTTRVSRCQKKSSSGLYGARGDIRGRHADNPAGSHSIRTNRRPTSFVPQFLRQMPFLPQPSQFILVWDRHQICWRLHAQSLGLGLPLANNTKFSKQITVEDYIYTFIHDEGRTRVKQKCDRNNEREK